MTVVAQLVLNQDGATGLRKIMLEVLDDPESHGLTSDETNAMLKLHAELIYDMKKWVSSKRDKD